jgi:peroxiredoxin
VIGVSVDEGDGDRVKRYAESNHLDFTVAHDPAGDIQHEYALVGVPTTFVIGRDGRLVWSHTGDIGDTFDDARAAVRRALAPAR